MDECQPLPVGASGGGAGPAAGMLRPGMLGAGQGGFRVGSVDGQDKWQETLQDLAALAQQCVSREEFSARLKELDPALLEALVQGQCPLKKVVLKDAQGIDRSGSWSAEVNDVMWKLQVKRHVVGRQATQTAAEVLTHVPGMEGVAAALMNVHKKSGEELGLRDLAGRALLKGDRAAQFWLARELLVR